MAKPSLSSTQDSCTRAWPARIQLFSHLQLTGRCASQSEQAWDTPHTSESPPLPAWQENSGGGGGSWALFWEIWLERDGGREGKLEVGVSGEKDSLPLASSCGESNNKSEVNPLPGRKLSLKPDEATVVQRESDTQTREQLLIPHRKPRMESSVPGGRPCALFNQD